MSPIKHNADSMQNSSTFPSQSKGKKRNRNDQTSESRKKENSAKHYGGDSVQLRSDNLLKSEIQKLAEKGLVDSDSVERLVQLMQPDKSHRKLDLSCRSMLAGILAATEKLDCLNLFLQQRGLPILDEWLKEVHKGKVGSTAKDGDKQVEDFLLVILDALDKLPVSLNALQMCNIGKSVNHLRSHKNLEILKKARGLVDTWKQRVEAEMNNNDAKSSSSQEVPMPARSKNDVSYDWKKHCSTSSEAVTKSSGQLASSKSASAKLVQGETTGRTSSASSGIEKSSSPPGSTSANLKQGQLKKSTVGGCSEPQTTAREEKSSTSSQSHTNSQFSNDRARKSGKEDANSSTARSKSMSKTSGASRHKKSANGLQGTTPSGAEKESGTNKQSTLFMNSVSEKVSQSTITCENALATPVAKSNKMILKIHNRGCSPGKSSTAGSVNEVPCTKSRASSPALSGKCNQADAVLKKISSNHQTDKVGAMPEALPEQCGTVNDTAKLPDVSEVMPTAEKGSEVNTSVTVGDDIGMNLLASVASGEMSRSGNVSLSTSPLRSTATADNPSANYQGIKQSNGAEPSSGIHKKLDEFVGEASIATSSACALGKDFIDDSKQIHMKAAIFIGEKDSVTDAILATAGSLEAEHVVKDGTPFEEEETGDSSFPCVSTSTKVHNGLVARSSDADVLVEDVAKLKAGDTSEADASGLVDVNMKQRDENYASSNPRNVESGANIGKKIDCKDDIPGSSGSPVKVVSSSGVLEPQLSSKNGGPIASIEEKKDKHSAAAAITLSAAGVPDTDKKLEFDLNEGFNMDEMKSGELIDFAAPSLPTSVSFMGDSYSSVSSASVSVVAAAERSFVPSEDLLRNKTELGWKGLSSGSCKAAPHDGMACKQVRPLLDIDLNVTDERILQDISTQSSGMKFNHKPDDKINSNSEFMGSRLSHYSGGFELDLNRIDEAPELGQDSAGHSLHARSFSSIAPAIVEASTTRDFDLNNGPALDDKTFEPLGTLQAHSNNTPQPHFELRMNNKPTISSKSLWDSPGTTYSAVTIATPLPDRGDLPFPIMAAGPPQRILSGLNSGTSFNPDFYRGPTLSSSPSGMAFATAPLQYPVFPFGTSFPLSTSSLPGGSATYMDASLAPRFYASAIPAQFVGSAAAVSSQYVRPSIVGVPDIGSNSFGQSSQNSGRQGQGLDLNSGPGTLDVEGRDKALNISTRQFGALSQFPGGLSKRKEPDGGWDGDGNSYKQSSWR